MYKKYLLSFILTITAATGVQAAGYQLQEYSVTGLGRAFAGAGVMGDDYSAVAFNPAGMSLVEKSGLQMGAIAVDVYGKAKGESRADTATPTAIIQGTPKSGSTHSNLFRLLPHFYGQKKVNNKLDLGIGLYVPFGLANDYKNNWFGTEHGQYSGITVVNLTPSISYKVSNNLSLGLGINLQYTEAHLTGGVAGGGSTNMKHAKDTGVGYNVGLTYKPFETTRLGLSYRSKVSHKLHGHNYGHSSPGIDATAFLDGKNRVNAKITTPETVIFSAAQDIGKKWTLSGIVRWTRWSRFDQLDIYQDNAGLIGSTKENWRNTWLYGLGADYKYCKNLTFRFGGAWDKTAIRSAKFRTPRIPDERRIWMSVGASYMKNNWQVDVGYSHLFVRKAHANGSDSLAQAKGGYFRGKYQIQSDIFGLGVQYKF